MGARAIWKGEIRFPGVVLPVKLYSAVQDRSVHFRLLDRHGHAPVTQQMVNPATGEPVPYSETKRGFEVEPGVFVVLEQEDLNELEPEPSRDIEITRFVPDSAINHQWYVRPYWLGPGADDTDTYAALAQILEKRRLEGVARWVMRKKRYVGALRSQSGSLMLISLRHAEEVVTAADLPAPKGRPLDKRELEMAGRLVEAMSDDFDPAAYTDEYRERVEALVATKAKGGRVTMPKLRRRKEPESLASALEASLAGLKRRKASA